MECPTQEMLNSTTSCRYFVNQALEVVHKSAQSVIYHYMDDFLLASDTDTLEKIFNVVQKILLCWGLLISPEETQRGDSLNFLVLKLNKQRILYHKRYRLG